MKKFLLAFCFATSLLSYGQITLEKTYKDITRFGTVELSISGFKYFALDEMDQTLKLYNTNHSLWKSVSLNLPANYFIDEFGSISEELFDMDSKIEYRYVARSSANFSDATFYVVNETGNVLLSKDNVYGYVYNVAGQFKLIMESTKGDTSFVYSLPGTMPCDPCSNINGIHAAAGSNSGSGFVSVPVPNPSAEQAVINYQLPAGSQTGEIILFDISGKQIKSFTVDNTFQSLLLTNQDLASGTYYYQLKTASGYTGGKKMVVIH